MSKTKFSLAFKLPLVILIYLIAVSYTTAGFIEAVNHAHLACSTEFEAVPLQMWLLINGVVILFFETVILASGLFAYLKFKTCSTFGKFFIFFEMFYSIIWLIVGYFELSYFIYYCHEEARGLWVMTTVSLIFLAFSTLRVVTHRLYV